MVRKKQTSTVSDDQIKDCIRAGELERAAELCIAAYRVRILTFLTRTLNDAVAAEESFADFAELLWVKLKNFDLGTDLQPWLYGVARTARRRRIRSGQRKRARFLERDTEMLAQGSSQDLDGQLQRAESRLMLANLRAQLSDDERELITLYFDRDLKSSEVAEILGISPCAVRTRVLRVKRKLRDLQNAA